MNIKILIPVFNDWDSLNKLLEEINLIINGQNIITKANTLDALLDELKINNEK